MQLSADRQWRTRNYILQRLREADRATIEIVDRAGHVGTVVRGQQERGLRQPDITCGTSATCSARR